MGYGPTDIFNRFDMRDCPSNDIIGARGVTVQALITVIGAGGKQGPASVANQFDPRGCAQCT